PRMEVPLGAVVVVVVLAVIFALYLHGDRKAARQLAAEQREALGLVREEVTSLRSALVASGALEGAQGPLSSSFALRPVGTAELWGLGAGRLGRGISSRFAIRVRRSPQKAGSRRDFEAGAPPPPA